MIPIRDEQPRFSTPYLNNFLIGLNLLIFLFESVLDPASLKIMLFQFGVIPSHVTALLAGRGGYAPASVLLPFFTSMFLHGSWMHVIGNMWFLWIFGDNIEDQLGHFTYLIFYLLSGVVAAMTQVALDPGLRVPTVGASGAIAGVLGAYFVLYPKARVLTWFPPIFFFHLPAWIMLGYWFVLQFLSGAASSIAYSSQTSGGIAFWAHVGGFVAGVILIKILPERPRRYRYGTW
jgi:membrane associated rhomboid family serine protease